MLDGYLYLRFCLDNTEVGLGWKPTGTDALVRSKPNRVFVGRERDVIFGAKRKSMVLIPGPKTRSVNLDDIGSPLASWGLYFNLNAVLWRIILVVSVWPFAQWIGTDSILNKALR